MNKYFVTPLKQAFLASTGGTESSPDSTASSPDSTTSGNGSAPPSPELQDATVVNPVDVDNRDVNHVESPGAAGASPGIPAAAGFSEPDLLGEPTAAPVAAAPGLAAVAEEEPRLPAAPAVAEEQQPRLEEPVLPVVGVNGIEPGLAAAAPVAAPVIAEREVVAETPLDRIVPDLAATIATKAKEAAKAADDLEEEADTQLQQEEEINRRAFQEDVQSYQDKIRPDLDRLTDKNEKFAKDLVNEAVEKVTSKNVAAFLGATSKLQDRLLEHDTERRQQSVMKVTVKKDLAEKKRQQAQRLEEQLMTLSTQTLNGAAPNRPQGVVYQLANQFETVIGSPSVQGQALASLHVDHSKIVLSYTVVDGKTILKVIHGRQCNQACNTLLGLAKDGIFGTCDSVTLICVDGEEAARHGGLANLHGKDALFGLDSTNPQADPFERPILAVEAGSIDGVIVSGRYVGVVTSDEGLPVFVHGDLDDTGLNGGFKRLSIIPQAMIEGCKKFAIAEPLSDFILVAGFKTPVGSDGKFVMKLWLIDMVNGRRGNKGLILPSDHVTIDLPANTKSICHAVSGSGTFPTITRDNLDKKALRSYNEMGRPIKHGKKADTERGFRNIRQVKNGTPKLVTNVSTDFIALIKKDDKDGFVRLELAHQKEDGSENYKACCSSSEDVAPLLENVSSIAGGSWSNGVRFVLGATEQSVLAFPVPGNPEHASELPRPLLFDIGNPILDMAASAEGGASILVDEQNKDILLDDSAIIEGEELE